MTMTRNLFYMLFLGMLPVAVLWGCSETDQTHEASDGASDSDSDSDTDGDSDSDSDADTDSDSDSDGDVVNEACIVAKGDPLPEGCTIRINPSCGDGIKNQDWEVCDDGNTTPGDGANGRCAVEPNYTCDTDAKPCTCKTTIVCGNGKIEPGEVCDDNNTKDDDGCNSTCDVQEEGWVCREGEKCEKMYACGNNRIESGEECEDGNTESDDGCDEDCKIESGWECPIPMQACQRLPRCGDGKTRFDLGEQCDDGNTKSDDGCKADCSKVEDGYECPSEGGKCTLLETECGDGNLDWDEECDDNNTKSDDGCTDDCRRENGYVCPYQGAPCIPDCGDGIVTASESCDDGNDDDEDGCTSECKWEEGKTCKYIKAANSETYECKVVECGDGVPGSAWRSTIACDDGNKEVGDGCSPLCQKEPICETGKGCTSECGDGIVIGDEECDDGNTRNLDGCDAECKVEPGYDCDDEELNGLGSSMEVLAIYKDIIEGDSNYPDFEQHDLLGCNEVSPDIVKDELNDEGKPELGSGAGSSPDCDWVNSASSFAKWYDHNEGDQDAIVVDTITLWKNDDGNYVNRWLEDGTQWTTYVEDNTPVWCAVSDSGSKSDCAEVIPGFEDDDDWLAPQDPCPQFSDDGDQICVFYDGKTKLKFDGNPAFFPLDGKGVDDETGEAVIPFPVYSGQWLPEEDYFDDFDIDEPDDYSTKHNFFFTSEVRFWFKYDPDAKQTLNFVGDDDVWVFVNGMLALDLGGIHVPLEGEFTIQDLESSHNLKDGGVYEIVVFQAERQMEGSSYKLTLGGFNAQASVCVPDCGDGAITTGEMCDNGDDNSNSAYNGCKTDCTLGPRCGDKVWQENYEDCDNGTNNDVYGLDGDEPCGPNCKLPPFCGDSVIQPQFGEECDDGVKNTGAYGACNDKCKLAPFCGDGKISDGELCDIAGDPVDKDGNAIYACLNCTEAPRCGDGELQDEWGEDCDGSVVNGKECTDECRFAGECGDGVVDKNAGEQCDYGDDKNDGSYGGCTPGCVFAPRCGDGKVQEEEGEECDAGDEQNLGEYGGCAPDCKMGPHCGDMETQEPYEECDEGNDDTDDRGQDDACTNSCSAILSIE